MPDAAVVPSQEYLCLPAGKLLQRFSNICLPDKSNIRIVTGLDAGKSN